MDKNSNVIAVVALVVVIVAAGAYYFFASVPSTQAPTTGTSTPVTGFTDTTTTPQGITFGHPDNYGLAVNADQVLVKAYIPPCSPGFDYCLYRNDATYADTNFESAGLRVQARLDLTTQSSCLMTPPEGYGTTTLANGWSSGVGFFTSVFANIGDAGAGHYASGSLYRLFVPATGTCTEFETRIGETQYANYPAGTKVEFTDTDRAAVKAELASILASVRVKGTAVTFPTVQ